MRAWKTIIMNALVGVESRVGHRDGYENDSMPRTLRYAQVSSAPMALNRPTGNPDAIGDSRKLRVFPSDVCGIRVIAVT